MTTIIGTITNVQTEPLGSVVVSWTGNSLVVADAVEFPETGQFTWGGTVFDYTAIDTDAAAPYDTLTVTETAPAGVNADDPVTIYPAASERIADVVTPEGVGESIPCVVPHALQPLLADGPRDDTTGEAVEIEEVRGVWYVRNVLGQQAQIVDPVVTQQMTDIAFKSASGKTTVTHSTSTPPATYSGTTGDTWFEHDATTNGVVGLWSWDGTQWNQMVMNDQVIGNLDAGSITTGTLTGITLAGNDIYTPDASSLPRVHMGSSILEVVRSDSDGNPRSTVSLGGANADALFLYDTSGNPLAGFDTDGTGVMGTLSAAGDGDIGGGLSVSGDTLLGGDLVVYGQSLSTQLSPLPQGIVASDALGSAAVGNNVQFGSTDLGYYGITWDSYPNRRYRIVYNFLVWVSTAGNYSFTVRATSNPNHGVVPAVPTTSSPTWTSRTMYFAGGGYYPVHLEFTSPASSLGDGTYCTLLFCRTSTTGAYGQVFTNDTTPGFIFVEDIGAYLNNGDAFYSQGGGTPYSGTTTTTTTTTGSTTTAKTATTTYQPRTYTNTWAASAVQSWKGGTAQTVSSSLLQQGYYPSMQRYSSAEFGAANSSGGQPNIYVSTALTGSHVSSLQVYLLNRQWYYSSGGTAYIGLHMASSGTSSPQTSGTPSPGVVTVSGWGVGVGKWVTLPTSWASYLATGAADGITIGEGAGTSLTSYGKFDPSASNVKLRATYSK